MNETTEYMASKGGFTKIEHPEGFNGVVYTRGNGEKMAIHPERLAKKLGCKVEDLKSYGYWTKPAHPIDCMGCGELETEYDYCEACRSKEYGYAPNFDMNYF